MASVTEKRRRLLYLLGRLPGINRKVSGRLVGKKRSKGRIIERLSLKLNGLEDVPALLVKPAHVSGRLPAVLYNHSHGGRYKCGKDELIKGAPYLYKSPYAEDLCRQGYAVLCIDHWCFGGRNKHREEDTFKEMLWQGSVMWGMMVYDSLQALKYLKSRKDIDDKRIATLGMSMGSTMAWWLGALSVDIKVCIDICCMTDFEELIKTGGLKGHGIYYYVPGLMEHFTTADINSLIAPRPHLCLAGAKDPLTPLKGLRKIDKELKKVYRYTKAEKNWQMHLSGLAHRETSNFRKAALAFLKKHL